MSHAGLTASAVRVYRRGIEVLGTIVLPATDDWTNKYDHRDIHGALYTRTVRTVDLYASVRFSRTLEEHEGKNVIPTVFFFPSLRIIIIIFSVRFFFFFFNYIQPTFNNGVWYRSDTAAAAAATTKTQCKQCVYYNNINHIHETVLLRIRDTATPRWCLGSSGFVIAHTRTRIYDTISRPDRDWHMRFFENEQHKRSFTPGRRGGFDIGHKLVYFFRHSVITHILRFYSFSSLWKLFGRYYS